MLWGRRRNCRCWGWHKYDLRGLLLGRRYCIRDCRNLRGLFKPLSPKFFYNMVRQAADFCREIMLKVMMISKPPSTTAISMPNAVLA